MLHFIYKRGLTGENSMASIKVSDLSQSGSDLFHDSESYFSDLNESDVANTNGGAIITFIGITLYVGYRLGAGNAYC